MLSYSEIKTDLIDSTHNQLNQVSSLMGLVNRAIRVMKRKTDFKGTERSHTLVAGTGDYDYVMPVDMKSNAIINVLDSDGNAVDADFIMAPSLQEFQYHANNLTDFDNVVFIDNIDGGQVLYIYSDWITPVTLRYYSNEYVLAIDGVTYKEAITSDDDRIAVDDMYYESFLGVCEILADRYNREMATGDLRFDAEFLREALADVMDLYPSERLEIIGTM